MATNNGEVPGFIKNNERYKIATAFMETASACEGADYKWVLDYAKGLWEYRNKTFNLLDEKAESVIKYLGGGAGLFAIGALAKIDATNSYIAFWAIPAVVCALAAILLAMLSKSPGPFPGLPTIQNAKAYADDLKNEGTAIAAFLGQWNLACEKARLICERKASFVVAAVACAYVALVLLVVPLLVAIYKPHY
jgi:hypothetical protein